MGAFLMGHGMTIETEFLCCCARTRLEGHHADRLRELAESRPDWDCIIRQAAAHKVLPLLFLNVKRACRALVPEPFWQRLRAAYVANGQRNLLLSQALGQILDLFAAHEILAVPFKGPTLARQAFGSIALRSFVDLDILIHPGRVEEAADLLIAAGYTPECELNKAYLAHFLRSENQLLFVDPDNLFAVELHWELSGGYFAQPLDLAALQTRLGTIRFVGRTVPALAQEDLLLYLCVHGNQHTWDALDGVCCVAQVAGGDIDWPALVERATATGALRMVLIGLQLTHRLLGYPLAPEVQRAIAADHRVLRLSEAMVRNFWGRENAERLVTRRFSCWHLQTLANKQDAWRFALRTLFVPTRVDLYHRSGPYRFPGGQYLRRPVRLGLDLLRKLVERKGKIRSIAHETR